MVDLTMLQPISYMAGAIGVCVAGFYYALNLRETTRNRKTMLTTNMLQYFMTKEGVRHFAELNFMDWKDLDDYNKKYDSRVNVDNFISRMSMWNLCENIGFLYREGLVDLRTLRYSTNGVIEYLWLKFKPVIEMYRATDFGPKSYENWEYLAEKLIEYQDVHGHQDSTKRMVDVTEDHLKNIRNNS